MCILLPSLHHTSDACIFRNSEGKLFLFSVSLVSVFKSVCAFVKGQVNLRVERPHKVCVVEREIQENLSS